MKRRRLNRAGFITFYIVLLGLLLMVGWVLFGEI